MAAGRTAGYSYRAMPWKRAKALPPPDNTLFETCFRIQREACAAAGRHIPLIVENVRGAQKWVGRARWNYGSFYLWGDVPALMPPTLKAAKQNRRVLNKDGHNIILPQVVLREGFSSKSSARKMASAMIAKIPLPLSRHIAATFHPGVPRLCEAAE